MSDWDPDAWLAELKGKLERAGTDYLARPAANDDLEEIDTWPPLRSNRATFAALAIGQVMIALGRLPGMTNNVGLTPLHDVIAAIFDLQQGGQPELLKPVRGVGKGREHTGRRFVRQHALLGVTLLTTLQMGQEDACKLVATILGDAGHSGRKQAGGARAISYGTVSGWWNATRQSGWAKADLKMAAFLDRQMAMFRAGSDWPLTIDQASKILKAAAAEPVLMAKV
ncbi:hypothetical protein SPAN111604_05395 [Sphingomonas antarctica]|uniref:hypothetical protein n=1 Tax=Sphingomonas antarctica TaxID=2040274 RepID=UPI0039E984F6